MSIYKRTLNNLKEEIVGREKERTNVPMSKSLY